MAKDLRSGSSYTLDELAASVQSALQREGMSYREAARRIVDRHGGALRSTEAQISMAMRDPQARPGTVVQLLEVLGYCLAGEPTYKIRRCE